MLALTQRRSNTSIDRLLQSTEVFVEHPKSDNSKTREHELGGIIDVPAPEDDAGVLDLCIPIDGHKWEK